MGIGSRIIDYIIEASLFHYDDGIIIWSANAPEQIESFVVENVRAAEGSHSVLALNLTLSEVLAENELLINQNVELRQQLTDAQQAVASLLKHTNARTILHPRCLAEIESISQVAANGGRDD